MVGHLGAKALAGLGIASTILQTAVGLMVFLAYATTPLVARRLGARDFRGALQAGVDGLYLAWFRCGACRAHVRVSPSAHWTVWARPRVCVHLSVDLTCRNTRNADCLSCFRTLTRRQDTRTPLYVSGIGFMLNAGLNAVLITVLDLDRRVCDWHGDCAVGHGRGQGRARQTYSQARCALAQRCFAK